MESWEHEKEKSLANVNNSETWSISNQVVVFFLTNSYQNKYPIVVTVI